MARVISWRIDGKYVYIEDLPYIRTTPISSGETRELGERVTTWSFERYRTHFNQMLSAVTQEWGIAVDINHDAEYYFNAAGEKGVYMLAGIDGENLANAGAPFYTIVNENVNTSVGLGGDNVLDVPATIRTKLHLVAKNGEKTYADIVTVSGIQGITHNMSIENNQNVITITIPKDTEFSGNTKVRSVTITVSKGAWTGATVMTVIGIKDGLEGVSYDLIVAPKQIKVSSAEDLLAMTSCRVAVNGVPIEESDLETYNLAIKSMFDTPTDDEDDAIAETTPYPYNSGITANEIDGHGGEVTFYLFHKGKLIDSDSCTVTRDGKDGGGVHLELDNEIDGVAVGSDFDLDLPEGDSVTLSTEFEMYSGSTKLYLTDVSIEGFTDRAKSGQWYEKYVGSKRVGRAKVEILSDFKGKLTVELYDGYDFGVDERRDVIKIVAKGKESLNSSAEETAKKGYTILAVPGGTDGEVFKLRPNYDEISHDPNGSDPYGIGEYSSNLTVDAYLGTNRLTDTTKWESHTSTSFTVDGREYFVGYTLDCMYNTDIPGDTFAYFNGTTPRAIDIVGNINQDRKYIVFYLFVYVEGYGWWLADRESVPFIYQGKDGNAVWVELGNEVDAVSVGDDSDLDLVGDITSVTLTTDVRLFSSGTVTNIDEINIVPVESETLNQYTPISDKFECFSNHPDGDYTKWKIYIILKDGFEFGDNYKEKFRIDVTANKNTDDEYTEYAYYTITAVKGGKDGYVYRLVPEVDFVHYHANVRNEEQRIDEETLECTAYYGENEIGSGWTGYLFYSINKIYQSIDDIGDNIDDISGLTPYQTDMIPYPSGGILTKDLGITNENYTAFKYIVFYLVIEDQYGAPMIVDRETIPIIADGLNGGERLYVELGNEIDSVGTGTDTKLDVVDPVTASTTVTLFSGATELLITGVSGRLVGDSDPSHSSIAVYIIDESGNTTSSSPSPSNPAKKVEFNVYLENGFEFGRDLKEKVLIEVSGLDLDGSAVTAYTTFVIAAVVGGKDGATYKIQPTPDYVVYDFNLPGFIGTNNVSAKAYCGGVEMTGDTYEILYGLETVYDLDNVDVSVLETYDGPISFPPPVNGLENRIAFYLKVGDKIVDRETVPLVLNGKNGENGSGSVSFDLSNENWVVTTGEDTILDIVNQITGGTFVSCVSGNTNVILHAATAGTMGSYATVEIQDNDTARPFIKVTLRKNFDFGETQRKDITITCTGGTGENAANGVLLFGLVCVKNGKGGDEGKSYKLVTSAGSILYDSNNETYGPVKLTCKMYLGNEEVSMDTCKYTIHNNETNSDVVTNRNFPSTGLSDYRNVRLGSILISGTTSDGGWDACDVPIIPSGKDGSGIVIDLTNDRDSVALGKDLVLDSNVEFSKTYASVYEGSSTCNITRIDIETPSIAQANKLTITSGVTSGNKSAWLQVAIASPFNFSASDIEGGQIPIYAVVSAVTSEGTVQKRVKYTILGFQGGEDGVSYQIVPSSSVIKRNIAADTYNPEGISAGINVGLNDSDENVYMYYTVNEEDGEDATYEPYGPTVGGSVVPNGYPKPVLPLTGSSALFVTDGLRNAVNFYAFYGGTNVTGILVDKETVPVVFDGNDGAGTLTIQVSPTSIPIPVNEQGHPEGLVTGRTLVSMWSGTTQIGINTINVTSSYSDFGDETSNKNVKYKVSSAGDSYEWVSFSATTNATITGKIEVELEAIALGTGGMTRRAVITIEPAVGKNGRNGAAVLGPTQFEDNGIVGRRWHSGNDNVLPGDTPTPEDLQFIDIIVRVENGQKVYYYCSTSYTDTGAAWSTVSSRWTRSQEQYDFVATKLLLAENAKINFITGNELYLTNSAGTVTGGARAASSSDDVVFWAGSDQPGNGNFQVTYNGDLIAKSGTFSGYVRYPYTHVYDLPKSADNTAYLADERANIIVIEYWDGPDILKLPAPTASLNGFTYNIICTPITTRSGQASGIKVMVNSTGTHITDGNYIALLLGTSVGQLRAYNKIFIDEGEFVIKCLPSFIGGFDGYFWAMTTATGTYDVNI